MIEYIEGDIFESPAHVIVNTVNTVGVMGKGIALSFKKRYPAMFERYKAICEKGLLKTGKLMLFYEADYWVLLFPTKEHWRNPSKLEYIEAGLQKFVQTYAEKGIDSIAFPRLGCGNGELDWNDVKPIMEKYLKKLPINVYIYLGMHPDAEPEHKTPEKTLNWLRRHAKDMSFTAVKDDLMHLGSILPYEFESQSVKYSMRYTDNYALTFTSEGCEKVYEIDENMLYTIWQELRKTGVFVRGKNTKEQALVCDLLFSAGYLSKIRIYDHSSESMQDGYQLNAGINRMAVFR
ncbi:MAG: phosphatase [Akkermansiaceae bacterium]|nr:phosphatase [Akkermansiaceae bacterium]